MQRNQIQLTAYRCVSNKSVEEKLGLPRKPKRPRSGYYHFLIEHQASVKENNPKLPTAEILKIVASMWSNTSDREEYAKGFQDDQVRYTTEMSEYQRTLSEDDRLRIKELKAKIATRKAELRKRKQQQDLGKPKRPVNAFVKFSIEQNRGRHQSKGKQTMEEYHQFYREITYKWRALSDEERAKYRSPKAAEDYK